MVASCVPVYLESPHVVSCCLQLTVCLQLLRTLSSSLTLSIEHLTELISGNRCILALDGIALAAVTSMRHSFRQLRM